MAISISHPWISVRLTPDVLVPAWIGLFGFVVLTIPPAGAALSLGLFVAGVIMIPAALLLPRASGGQPNAGVQP